MWTVAVVPHPLVTAHHHRHSLELVSVEARVIEIVVVIAHAEHFSALALPLSPAGGGAGSNPGGSPGESGGPRGARGVSGGLGGTSGSSKKVNLAGDGELVSSPLSFSCVTSGS